MCDDFHFRDDNIQPAWREIKRIKQREREKEPGTSAHYPGRFVWLQTWSRQMNHVLWLSPLYCDSTYRNTRQINRLAHKSCNEKISKHILYFQNLQNSFVEMSMTLRNILFIFISLPDLFFFFLNAWNFSIISKTLTFKEQLHLFI